MKIEITSEDYKDYYEAVDWDPTIFERLLRHLDYDFGNLTVDGALNLDNSKITHFVGVKKVTGSLWLNNTQIISLAGVKRVGGLLYLQNTPISQKHSKEEISQMIKVKYGIIY